MRDDGIGHIETAAELRDSMRTRIGELLAENARLKAALEFIANLEPGSRGAYSKFMQAKDRACEAISKPKGGK